jgi:hypothetical protein
MSSHEWKGYRTLFAGVLAMGCLVAGIVLVEAGDRGSAFFAFASGIVGVMATLAGKSAVGLLADGTGIQGAKNSLMTNAKPGTPAPPKPPQPNG